MAESERRTIAYLDVPTFDGRMISSDGFTWSMDYLPLMHNHEIVGTVSEIEVEDDYKVTALLSEVHPGFAPEIDVDEVEHVMVDGVYVMTKARLRSVVLGKHPAWPGLVE